MFFTVELVIIEIVLTTGREENPSAPNRATFLQKVQQVNSSMSSRAVFDAAQSNDIENSDS